MTLWVVRKFYDKYDNEYYQALPYYLWGHIKCCIKWYGWKGMKHTYLSEKKATKVALKLTQKINIGR